MRDAKRANLLYFTSLGDLRGKNFQESVVAKVFLF